LNEAVPDGCQELISPDLIHIVNRSIHNVIDHFIVKGFLFINEILPQDVSLSNDQSNKPYQVESVDEDNWIEFTSEVDVSIEEEESNWAVLDHIS
jgi:hypothetical protein